MMADGGPEHSGGGGVHNSGSSKNPVLINDLHVHIKQELDNASCCSPSPSTMQSQHSEKNFNNNLNHKACNVIGRMLLFAHLTL